MQFKTVCPSPLGDILLASDGAALTGGLWGRRIAVRAYQPMRRMLQSCRFSSSCKHGSSHILQVKCRRSARARPLAQG